MGTLPRHKNASFNLLSHTRSICTLQSSSYLRSLERWTWHSASYLSLRQRVCTHQRPNWEPLCYEAAASLSFSVCTYAKLCGKNSALCLSIVPKTLFARSPISSFCNTMLLRVSCALVHHRPDMRQVIWQPIIRQRIGRNRRLQVEDMHCIRLDASHGTHWHT